MDLKNGALTEQKCEFVTLRSNIFSLFLSCSFSHFLVLILLFNNCRLNSLFTKNSVPLPMVETNGPPFKLIYTGNLNRKCFDFGLLQCVLNLWKSCKVKITGHHIMRIHIKRIYSTFCKLTFTYKLNTIHLANYKINSLPYNNYSQIL